MGIFGNCNCCDQNLNFLRLPENCDFCKKDSCGQCLKTYYFQDFYGNPMFFTEKLKDLEINLPAREGYELAGSKIRNDCKMCENCHSELNMDSWILQYNDAVRHAHEITVIEQTANKYNPSTETFYRMQVYGNKLELIESFKIRAYIQGYDFIHELILEKGQNVWRGTCKAGKRSKI